jgi:nucleoid-associated protein YgaU
VTALAQPRRAVPSAVAPAHATALLRRVTGTWSEPEPWTVAVLLLTGVVVIARHPIAHALGTAVANPAAPTVVSAAPVAAVATATPARPEPAVAVPTHEPRDPFRALVNAEGRVRAPDRATPTTASRVGTTTGASCAGAAYRVVAGDTLWSIAARSIGATSGHRVDVAWHRVYAANRPAVGPNPAMLPVGARLCLPAA